MHDQQPRGVQATIRRFAAPTAPDKSSSGASDSRGPSNNKKGRPTGTLLALLAPPAKCPRTNSSEKGGPQKQVPAGVAAAAAAVATAPEPNGSKLPPQSRGDGRNSSSSTQAAAQQVALSPCPICGLHIPPGQLQQHMAAELAALDWAEEDSDEQQQQQQQQPAAASMPGQGAQQRQHQQHQQHQQPALAGCQQVMGRPQAPATSQRMPPPAARGGPGGGGGSGGPGSTRLPRAGAGKGRRTGGSSHGSVKSLSAAPSKPRGPEGAPLIFDRGFDHWGDSALHTLDDTSIGLDGGLQSVDASWEGIGRRALGPRTMP